MQLAQPVRMSGSGSSLFTLRDDPEWAESDAKRIREKYDGVGAMAVQVAPASRGMMNGDGLPRS